MTSQCSPAALAGRSLKRLRSLAAGTIRQGVRERNVVGINHRTASGKATSDPPDLIEWGFTGSAPCEPLQRFTIFVFPGLGRGGTMP